MSTVAKAAADVATAPRPPSLVQVATVAVEETLPRFRAVLPRGFDQDRFTNLVVAAVKREPKLVRCFSTERGRTSLLIAAIQCAGMGLEPNTPLREASLVPRRIKDVDEAQLMVEYRGLIKLARRSGQIATLYAEVVHERDAFAYRLGLNPQLDHEPYDGDDPGELTHAYAVVEFVSRARQFVVVPKRVIETKHRARSDSWRSERSRPYSPWTTDTEAMWRKTAVRVLEPYLPLTIEAKAAMDVTEPVAFDVEADAIVPAGSLATDDVIDVDDEPDDDAQGDDEDAAWVAAARTDPTTEEDQP